MLTDVEIIEAVRCKEIVIQVYVSGKDQDVIDPNTGNDIYSWGALQPHGYDLRVFAIRRDGAEDWIALETPQRSATIAPGETVDIETWEKLALGPSFSATLHTMVRSRMLGLSSVSTTVHPTWGTNKVDISDISPLPLRIQVTNLGKYSVTLIGQQRFCRIIFHKLQTPPARLSHPNWDDIESPRKNQLRDESVKAQKENTRKIIRRQALFLAMWVGALAFVMAAGFFVLGIDDIRNDQGKRDLVLLVFGGILAFIGKSTFKTFKELWDTLELWWKARY